MLKKKMLIVLLVLFSLACSNSKKNKDVKPVKSIYSMKDLKALHKKDKILIKDEFQKNLFDSFKRKYFYKWHQLEVKATKKDVLYGFNKFKDKKVYGENKRLISPYWFKSLKEEVDLPSFPNTFKKAITIKNSNIRILPSSKPIFYDFKLAGEGFPFDNAQNSAIWSNIPLLVIHESKDGKWLYVETEICLGWIEASSVAYVDEKFIKKWENNDFVAVLKDNIQIKDEKNNYRITAMLSNVFPKTKEENKKEQGIKIAVSDENKNAKIIKAKIGKNKISDMPFELNQKNILDLINELHGRKYGWGGMFENRDCSSTLMELFIPFSIMLPRNSYYQSRYGYFVSFKGLKNEEKEKMIRANAIPFTTLIYKPGHIMLYVGSNKDSNLIFHNIWGLKTTKEDGEIGRKIFGKSMVTTLKLGKEIPLVNKALLDGISGMTFILPALEMQKDYSRVFPKAE